MSNFSISHFTLNKFEGMDGAMSWLAVIVIVIIIALPILFCCSSCACCRTCGMGIMKGTWFGVKGSCTLSWRLITYLYRKQQSRARGDDGCPGGIVVFEGEELHEVLADPVFVVPVPQGKVMDPVVNAKLILKNPKWRISKLFDERITVICKFGSKNFFYNLDSGTVFDDNRSNRDHLRPSPELLENVRYEMRTVKVPEMTLDGNRRTLVNFPDIYFDQEKARYRNVRTGVEESGFRKPIY